MKMKSLSISVALLAAFDAYKCQSSPEIVPVNGGVSGNGTTTRYWDCCKPSCGWLIPETNEQVPVQSCAVDGVTPIDSNAQSGCDASGSAYTCTNQQPWVINDTLAYGFVAASFTGGVDNHKCCACVLLSFQGQLEGKQLLAQITNTGDPLAENHFDIALPGGGVGIYNLGCISQWNAPENGWGERYGGINSETECSELPDALQPGCKFRFEFMEGVPNPPVTFYEVQCPRELSEITNCVSA
ncbi:endoglucanase-like [Cylas formicarius]|uniref:endoglucanase-like n=1 Tax=Cylas formicarius TaxID=197179 RepID=UPI00295892A6|nr:endoglucanase-like [Cylas formicarius]